MHSPQPDHSRSIAVVPKMDYAKHIARGGPANTFAAGTLQPWNQPTLAMANVSPVAGDCAPPLKAVSQQVAGPERSDLRAAPQSSEGPQSLQHARLVPIVQDQMGEHGTPAARSRNLQQVQQGHQVPADVPAGAANGMPILHISQQHGAGLRGTERVYSGHHHRGRLVVRAQQSRSLDIGWHDAASPTWTDCD